MSGKINVAFLVLQCRMLELEMTFEAGDVPQASELNEAEIHLD